MLTSHGRYPYAPITRKTAGTWPNGARLAVYFALGVEDYAFGEGLTENLLPGVPHPDLANASWRDYGNRVGAFRILDRFRRAEVPLAVLLNAAGLARLLWRAFSSLRGPFARRRLGSGSRAMNVA